MSNKKKRYTEEFRKTIVELHKSGKSLAELNSEYGIPKSTMATWVREYTPVVEGDEESMTLKELKELKKEMARIKEENEILKKAMAIFAKK